MCDLEFVSRSRVGVHFTCEATDALHLQDISYHSMYSMYRRYECFLFFAPLLSSCSLSVEAADALWIAA